MLNIKRRPNEKQTFPEREHSPLPDLFLSGRGHPFPYYSHLTSSPKSPILKSCVYAYHGQGWYNMRSGAGLSEPAGPNTLSLSLTLTLAVWRHTDVIPLFWGNTSRFHGLQRCHTGVKNITREQDGSGRHLEFLKIQFLVTRLSSSSISAVVRQISSKSDDFSVRYGDLTIFKMAAVRHLGF